MNSPLMSRTRWDLRNSVLTAVVLASLAGMVLATQRGPLPQDPSASFWPLNWVGWPVAGWMILVQRPGNRIGRLSLAVGVSLAFLDVHIGVVALVIGLCTLVMVTAGIMLGRALGALAGKRAEIVGGMILLVIGAAILYEHLSGAA